jgi:hypothetical protein
MVSIMARASVSKKMTKVADKLLDLGNLIFVGLVISQALVNDKDYALLIMGTILTIASYLTGFFML